MAKLISITEDVFGTVPGDGESKGPLSVRRFTLVNDAKMVLQVMNYGATITSIQVPDKDGIFRDVVLGFDNTEGYWGPDNSYFGAAIGRVANRTGNATFALNGETHNISPNDGDKHHLHGGFRGFDKRIWDFEVGKTKVTFTYVCVNGEEGYPGQVTASVSYELTQDNQILVNYEATTTRPTPVSLTNHSYFNLSGHDTADQELKDHVLTLNANQYTPVDSELIPTGDILDVEGTVYDFRVEKNLYDILQGFDGYDHNFCINQSGKLLDWMARVRNETTKIALDIYSDKPGIQFYSGNFLPNPANGEAPVLGKGNAKYCFHGAFCLETQNYPNAINLPHFPSSVLNPGEVYTHSAIFKFYVAE